MTDRRDIENMIIHWRQVREDRLAADKVAAQLKEHELETKNWIINVLRDEHWEGFIINGRQTSLRVGEQPTCEDKVALTDYILTSGALDLLEFRLAKRAIAERRDHGFDVPGVRWVDVYDLSDKKA